MTQLTPGARLGPYTLEKTLGAGGMGTVFLARHGLSGMEVALKVMNPEAASIEGVRRRFIREGRVTMALDHPNVIRILECFEHEGQPVIAMEVLRGCSLTEALQRGPQPGLARISDIMARVTSAVGTAHSLGLVHRDLKPDNIFILDRDPFVKVLDFGIAKLRKGFGLEESSALTRTGMLVGTPYYMSPEQAFGEKSIDHRADIWSLGLILYEALIGILPTKADTLQEVLRRLMTMRFERLDKIDPKIPKDVADLVERMLSRDRENRPADLREVYVVLARYAGELTSGPGSFQPAITPIPLDEPTATSKTEIAPAPSSTAEPLKLTPSSLKPSSQVGGAGTLLLEPSRPSRPSIEEQGPAPIAPGAATVISPGGSPVVSPPPVSSVAAHRVQTAPSKGVPWMWIVAAVLVAACVAVLLTQLR